MSEHKAFPWGDKDPDAEHVYILKTEDIQIPEPRVTSVFTPDQWREFIETLKVEGQKDPIKCILVDGKVYLEDGLNRIMGLRELKVTVAKALVRKGSIGDVQIGNIITARHRGRENPAQTADVILDLVDNEGMDKDIVRARLGLSASWFTKLYKIAKLPPEIKDHIKHARLSVAAAYHLCYLEKDVDRIAVANDAVMWHYTEEQTKDRVITLLNPDVPTDDVAFTYGPGGQPNPVYPHCAGCDVELKENATYVWLCPGCRDASKAFFAQYNIQTPQGETPTGP